MKKTLFFFFAFFSLLKLSAAPDIVWSSPPDTLSSALVDSSNASVGMDADGNAIALWLEDGFVKTASHPAMGSWGSATTLSGADATSPQLAVNANGDAVAVWIEGDLVQASFQPSGSAWGSADMISSSVASDPQVTITVAGDAVAVWVRSNVIESATKPIGMAWSIVATVSGSDSDHPAVAAGDDGTIIAVWHSIVSMQDRVLSSSYTVGGVWSASPLTVSSGSNSNDYPQVAVDASGNATALWYQFNVSSAVYSNVVATVSTLANGDPNWGTPFSFFGNGQVNPALLEVHVTYDSIGNTVALWSNSYDGQNYQIETSTFQVGDTTWSDVGSLDINLYNFEGDVAVASSVSAAAAFMAYDGMNILIQTTESNINSTSGNLWTAPQTISASSSNNEDPHVALALSSSTVYAAAVWTSFDGMNTVIQAVTGSTTAVEPPSAPMVAQSSTDFGVLTEYFNTLTWTESMDPDLFAYEIYRNGIYIDRVMGGTEMYIDHNAVQNGDVTYGVAALNSTGFQSQTVNVTFP